MKLVCTVFWRAIKADKKFFLWFIPISLLQSTFWVIEPLYGRYAIDTMVDGMTNSVEVKFFQLMGMWLLIYICINIFQALSFYFKWGIQHDILARTREIYYDHILRLDIEHHVRARGGELMKTIDNAADNAVDLSRQVLLDLLPMIITAIAFFIISFQVSWQLASIIIVVLPLYMVIMSLYVRHTWKHIDKVNLLWVKSIGRGYDALINIFSVKSASSEHREVETMQKNHREGIRELRKVNLVWSTLEGIGYFMLIRILVTGTGMYLFLQGDISLGSVFFFQFSFFRMIVPLETLGNIMPRWNEHLGKLKLGEDLYQQKIAVLNAPDAKELSNLEGAISFKKVSFAYNDIDTISNIQLNVQPGEHIAFVGHSGAGKSTLALLLNRFYDVTDGSITVDGTDLRKVDLHWWRSQVGLVLQENITFNDTVLENIRYARPHATEEEVIEAAKKASAHSFIEAFPNGYNTLVGERGIRLSGGERQRLAIARAVLKEPKIVVLDEATSALDSVTERAVQQGIETLVEGRTSFIIAHRLSTVRSVDRIAVLDKGKLVACAPHEELLESCDIYRTMVELQSHGMLAE